MSQLKERTSKLQVGDKVLHTLSKDEDMIGTIKNALADDLYIVEFWIPRRRKNGYMIELEFNGGELMPCFIDIESTRRNNV